MLVLWLVGRTSFCTLPRTRNKIADMANALPYPRAPHTGPSLCSSTRYYEPSRYFWSSPHTIALPVQSPARQPSRSASPSAAPGSGDFGRHQLRHRHHGDIGLSGTSGDRRGNLTSHSSTMVRRWGGGGVQIADGFWCRWISPCCGRDTHRLLRISLWNHLRTSTWE